LAALLVSCGPSEQEKLVKEGRNLAKIYCGNCHLTPDPSLLDKVTWRDGVLPGMAERLGIEVLEGNIYLHSKQSALSSTEWQKLIRYYEILAPESLPGNQEKRPKKLESALFTTVLPQQDSVNASTMLVRIDSTDHSIYIGRADRPALLNYNSRLRKELVASLPSPPVDLFLTPESPGQNMLTCMGGMQALDFTIGQVFQFEKAHRGKPNLISKDLIRPIETKPIDHNNDGLMDYTICAFGHNQGGLYLLKQLSDQKFEKVVLRAQPGATLTNIRDFNEDGWPDIMALFAHGDEGIWIFINDQKGGFTERNVLRFPSVFGSSSFQLADMNGDGMEDIVYTAGDNSDYSRILKPYHGLYIFTNTGNFNFKQTFFYPINGCTKAIVADFNKDGKPEIATIAFFADLKNRPFEKFLLFEQDPANSLNFTPASLGIDSLGRWIAMDAADWDGDGDMDIVLGNFSRGFLNQDNLLPAWNTRIPFVILENNLIKKAMH
jgi:hypothetical protein